MEIGNLISSFKDRLPYGVRVFLGKTARRIRYSALFLKSLAKSREPQRCSVCQSDLVGFVHGGKLCPFCTSFPRHRALLPLIETWIQEPGRDVKLLHVAPDACMREQLLKNRNLSYTGIDRFTPGHYYPPDTLHGDIENLDIDDGCLDLIICLHVLEHVDDDKKAVRELARVLAPGGILLLAFPFRNGRPTYEDPAITDPAERALAFGQWDHVRYFGEDVVDRISAAGLIPKKTVARDMWDPNTIAYWGLLPDEVFFICRKPGESSPLSQAEY